jgi:hypothetical protein
MKKLILVAISIISLLSYSQESYADTSFTENPDYHKGMDIVESLFTLGYWSIEDDISEDISYYWCDVFDLECGGISNFEKTYFQHLDWGLEAKLNDAKFSFFGPTISEYNEIDDFTGEVIHKESTNMYLQWTWITDDGDMNYILFGFTLDENNEWELTEVQDFPKY